MYIYICIIVVSRVNLVEMQKYIIIEIIKDKWTQRCLHLQTMFYIYDYV
jgi:hypothetical protein